MQAIATGRNNSTYFLPQNNDLNAMLPIAKVYSDLNNSNNGNKDNKSSVAATSTNTIRTTNIPTMNQENLLHNATKI